MLLDLLLCHMCNGLWNSWSALKFFESWKHEFWLSCKHADISICAQHPEGLNEGYWVYKQNPSVEEREGYITVILSSTTLDKGLAALKLAITSKHSLWCSSYSFDGNLANSWCSERTPNPKPFPNADIKPRLYTNASQRHRVLGHLSFYI